VINSKGIVSAPWPIRIASLANQPDITRLFGWDFGVPRGAEVDIWRF
jgi:hypothetical protein